jgi:plasminogen activator
MNIQGVLPGFAIALSLGVSLPAISADLGVEDTLVVDEAAESIATVYGGIGIISIEANEYVYQSATTDNRLSQLIWQSTAPILTAGLDVNLPEGWTLSAKAQVAMGGDSYMEDYDWIAPWATGTGDDDWSHRSQHDDTDLDWYFNGTILLGHDFAISDNVTVNVNGGLKYTDVQWAAYGGTYVYSDGGYRNDIGDFVDGEPAISYRQQLPAVVAGIDAQMVQGAWTFDLSAHGGLTFSGATTDNHWMRDLEITGDVQSAPILSVAGQASYEMSDGMSVFLGGSLEQVFTSRVDAHYDNTGVINDFDYPDGQGASLFAATISVGVMGTL